MLLVVTFRPEFQPPWIGQAQVTSLTLEPARSGRGATLVQRVVGNGTLPRSVAEIVERTDGVPLFVEEMTKAVLEADAGLGATPAHPLAVPATLQASLMARLDRLGSAAKEVAQVGAAIGREFSYELLAAVAQRTEQELAQALAGSSSPAWSFSAGRRRRPPTFSSTRWFRMRRIARCCGERERQLHARIARGPRSALPECCRGAATSSRAPFHRSRPDRTGNCVSVSGGPAVRREIGVYRGNSATEERVAAD